MTGTERLNMLLSGFAVLIGLSELSKFLTSGSLLSLGAALLGLWAGGFIAALTLTMIEDR